MESMIIDRIESKRSVKSQKLFMVLAICSIPLIIIKIYMGANGGTFQQIGYWLNILVLFVPIIIYVYQRNLTNNISPFIEWWTDKIVYKASTDKESITLLVATIKSVSIKLDEIIVVNKNNQSCKINIADFIEYNDRLKIKSNFEKLAASVASQQDYVA